MSPRRAVPQKKQESGLPTWLIAAGIVVAVVAVIVVGADFLSKAQPSGAIPVSGSTGTGRTKGNPQARVELVEFSDFQ